MEIVNQFIDYLRNVLINNDLVMYAVTLIICIIVISMVIALLSELFSYLYKIGLKMILGIFEVIYLFIQCIVYILRNKIITNSRLNTKIIKDIPGACSEAGHLIKLLNNRDKLESSQKKYAQTINASELELDIEIAEINIVDKILTISIGFNDLDKASKTFKRRSINDTSKIVTIGVNGIDNITMEEECTQAWWKYLNNIYDKSTKSHSTCEPPKLIFKAIGLDTTKNTVNIGIEDKKNQCYNCEYEVDCSMENKDILDIYKRLEKGFFNQGGMIINFIYIIQIIWSIVFLLLTGRWLGTVILFIISILITNKVVNINRYIIDFLKEYARSEEEIKE